MAASSWQLDSVSEVAELDGVLKVQADQCQFGAEDVVSGNPVRKRTGFLTNSKCLADSLTRACRKNDGTCSNPKYRGRRHELCRGGVARRAQVYSAGLCKAILRGIAKQLQEDGVFSCGEVGMQSPTVREVVHQIQRSDGYVLVSDENGGATGQYKDDLSGQLLVDSLVHEAMNKELDYFDDKAVWELRPREECQQRTGRKPITVRWVLTNKGDDGAPNYRARLVAR